MKDRVARESAADGELKPQYTDYDQPDEEPTNKGCGLSKNQDTQDKCSPCADAGPHRVGGADPNGSTKKRCQEPFPPPQNRFLTPLRRIGTRPADAVGFLRAHHPPLINHHASKRK